MKKNVLLFVCCGLLFLAGCKKGPVLPNITILERQGCVYDNVQVYSGVEIMVGFSCTGESLTQIEVVLLQNDSILASHIDSLNSWRNEPVPPYTYKHAFTLETIGAVTVKGTVTDAQGQVATTSFVINYNERPNERFVGHYEGDIFINGSYAADLSVIGLQEGDLDSIPFYTIADITAGDNINEVNGVLTLGDSPNTVRGTVDGDNIVFDQINGKFIFDYSYDGLFTINIPIEMDVVYTMHGTLIDGILHLEGDCQGRGEISTLGGMVHGPMTMEGTLCGSLTKNW